MPELYPILATCRTISAHSRNPKDVSSQSESSIKNPKSHLKTMVLWLHVAFCIPVKIVHQTTLYLATYLLSAQYLVSSTTNPHCAPLPKKTRNATALLVAKLQISGIIGFFGFYIAPGTRMILALVFIHRFIVRIPESVLVYIYWFAFGYWHGNLLRYSFSFR